MSAGRHTKSVEDTKLHRRALGARQWVDRQAGTGTFGRQTSDGCAADADEDVPKAFQTGQAQGLLQ